MQRQALLFAAVILFVPGRALATGCDGLVGKWWWFTGYVVTLHPDHTIVYEGKPAGKWSCTNAAKNLASLRWNSNFVDTVTVAGDRISGTNQVGYKVWANRSNPASDVKSPGPRAAIVTPRPKPQPAGGCQQGNWRDQCQRQLRNDPIYGPYPSQGAISNCIQQKMAACGNLVP